jgi:uncharacterized membrane protein
LAKSESWKTWLLVAALLIFAGLASATVPFIMDQLGSSDEPETLRETHPAVTTIAVSELPFIGETLVTIPFVAENIHGQPITMAQAFGIAFGFVLVAVGAAGLLLTVITVILSKWITNVYEDEDYQAAEAELAKQQKALLKDRQQEQPVAETIEPSRRIRWSAITFGFIVVLLVWISSILLGFSLFQDQAVSIGNFQVGAIAFISLSAIAITIIVLYLALRRHDPSELATPESDNKPVNWGAIWVIVTGSLVVGIGTGLAIAITSGG